MLAANGQTTNAPPAGNQLFADRRTRVLATTETDGGRGPPQLPTAGPTVAADTNAATTPAPPDLPDVRPIPLAVKASHPDLATVSPIAQNARDPHALDLQTCFQLTAVRDDSLKISTADIEIALAPS